MDSMSYLDLRKVLFQADVALTVLKTRLF